MVHVTSSQRIMVLLVPTIGRKGKKRWEKKINSTRGSDSLHGNCFGVRVHPHTCK